MSRPRTTLLDPSRAPTGTACDRAPLCEQALATNRELRLRLEQLERMDAARLGRQRNRAYRERDEAIRERDAARAEADAARIYLWQRLPWKGYAT